MGVATYIKDENDAIALLEHNYEAKNDFSFKQRADQLRIKQIRRKIKETKSALGSNPDNQQIMVELEKLSEKLNNTARIYAATPPKSNPAQDSI